jgi:4-carboxymuconolactone decarboxylase
MFKSFLVRVPLVTVLASLAVVAQDRMPPIPPDKMSPALKKTIEEIGGGPRTTGPFVAFGRSPELLARVAPLGDYLRFHNSLPQKLVEMATLMAARRWTEQFEWNAHAPLATKAGLKEEVVAAIAEGRRPTGMSDDEEIVYDFTTELNQTGGVSDAIYTRALHKFQEQGVIDLTAVDGYFSMLAMVMNVARTPLKPGDKPALKPLVR